MSKSHGRKQFTFFIKFGYFTEKLEISIFNILQMLILPSTSNACLEKYLKSLEVIQKTKKKFFMSAKLTANLSKTSLKCIQNYFFSYFNGRPRCYFQSIFSSRFI